MFVLQVISLGNRSAAVSQVIATGNLPAAIQVNFTRVCSYDYSAVCADDGRTYNNECLMNAEACKNRRPLRVVHHGECATDTGRRQFIYLFTYFIHQSTSIKRFTISQEKRNLITVWIKWPTQGRATYV